MAAFNGYTVRWCSMSCVCRSCLANDRRYLDPENNGGALLLPSFTAGGTTHTATAAPCRPESA